MLEFSLGIAGTAKNTGKTTTTAAILSALRKRRVGIYLTSIGYDGEYLDNVTGLPKPRVPVEPGDIVATASRCLLSVTASFQVIADTDIQTPLGFIRLVRITGAGLMVVAGPNKSSEVSRLLKLFRTLGPGIRIFDGALNRIAPMVETDGLILATGAALFNDIPRLAADTARIEKILNLSVLSGTSALLPSLPTSVCLFDAEGQLRMKMQGSSVFSAEDAEHLARNICPGGTLVIPGVIGEVAFNRLAACWTEQKQAGRLILADPVKLLVTGAADRFSIQLEGLESVGILVGVFKRLPLLAVTINPFYPQYRLENDSYHPAYVDFHRLQIAVRSQVTAPVFNVVRQGAEKLVDVIMTHAHPWRRPGAEVDLT